LIKTGAPDKKIGLIKFFSRVYPKKGEHAPGLAQGILQPTTALGFTRSMVRGWVALCELFSLYSLTWWSVAAVAKTFSTGATAVLF